MLAIPPLAKRELSGDQSIGAPRLARAIRLRALAEHAIQYLRTVSSGCIWRTLVGIVSVNHLNAAISRAQFSAIMVASTKLTALSCAPVERKALVNLLWQIAMQNVA